MNVTVCEGTLRPMKSAIYLDSIVYPNGRYQVSFIRLQRSDYKNEWDTNIGREYRVPFEKYYLSEVRVEHDADGNGVYEQLIRKYVFSYESDYTKRIFPGIEWPYSNSGPTKPLYQGMLTLTGVQEFGSDLTSLPATTFFYEDKMHLTRVENGYGGKVTFQYDQWYEPSGSSNTVYEDIGAYQQSCEGLNDNWFLYSGPGSEYCEGLVKKIRNTGTAGKSLNADLYTHPGGVYRVYAKYTYSTEGNHIRLGLAYKVGNDVADVYTLWQTGGTEITGYLKLPSDMTKIQTALINCDQCNIDIHSFALSPIKSRVVEKKIYDGIITSEEGGIDQPAIYTYKYDGGATNDTTHSAYINGTVYDDRYWKAYSEFRGHSQVVEVGPDGRATTTFYHQDDVFQGKPSVSIVSAADFIEDFEIPQGQTHFCFNADWDCSDGNIQYTIWQQGDLTLRNGGVSTLQRLGSITDKESVLLQFRTTSGTANTQQAILTLESESFTQDYAQWGITVQRGSDNKAFLQAVCVGCNTEDYSSPVTLINSSTYKDSTWYVLQLTIDDLGRRLVRVWERDNPAITARFESRVVEGDNTRAWEFKLTTNNGYIDLDTYQEGQITTITKNTYSSSIILKDPNTPKKTTGGGNPPAFPNLQIYWPYLTSTETINFIGGYLQATR